MPTRALRHARYMPRAVALGTDDRGMYVDMRRISPSFTKRTHQLCGATTVTTGERCQNPVAPDADHCRAGHYVARQAERSAAIWRPSTSLAPPQDSKGDTGTLDVPRKGDDVDQSIAMRIPKWRTQAAALSGAAGIAAFATGEAGLIAKPIAFVALGVIAAASTWLTSWINHRHDAEVAKATYEASSTKAILLQKRRVVSQVDGAIATLLEKIGDSRGKERDGYRGQLLAHVIDGIVHVFPEGTAVAMYRPDGTAKSLKSAHADRFVASGLHHGWTTNPPALASRSDEALAIKSVAVTGGVEQSVGADGRCRLLAPIVDDDTIFGVIRVDAPPGVVLDTSDVAQVGTWAKLIGVAHGTRPFLPSTR